MLKDIWVVMLVLGFVCMFLSLLLFFVWKIPSLLDELSGRKAKRQIQMLKDMSKSSGAFGGLSTSEVYSSIPSGSLLAEELVNISTKVSLPSELKGKGNDEEGEEDEETATSDMGGDDSTSYVSEEDTETSYIGSNTVLNEGLVIKILEEQSSL